MSDQSQNDVSPRIGSPVKTITNSLENSASMSLPPQPSSRITGSVKAASKPTGTELSAVASAPLPSALRAVLGDPEAVDSALVDCLPPRMRSSLRRSHSNRGYPYDLVAPIEPEDADTIRAWLAEIDRPAGRVELMQEITRCLSLTASRTRDDADLKMMLAALAEELQNVPADRLRFGLRKWARREKWWPTLKEILLACDEPSPVRNCIKHLISLDAKAQAFWIERNRRFQA